MDNQERELSPVNRSQTPSSLGQSAQIHTQPIPQAQKHQVPADAVNMELRRKLWDGLLPIKIDLALSDLNGMETPRSLYVSVVSQELYIDHGPKGELPVLHSDRSEVVV